MSAFWTFAEPSTYMYLGPWPLILCPMRLKTYLIFSTATRDGTEGSIFCKVASFHKKSCLRKEVLKPLPRIPVTDVTAEINECSRRRRTMAFSPYELIYVGVQHRLRNALHCLGLPRRTAPVRDSTFCI